MPGSAIGSSVSISKTPSGMAGLDQITGGTSDTLYLPRATAVVSRPAEAPLRAMEGAGHAIILLVDDDSDVREITVTLLESLGYSVIEAQSGGVVLDILAAGNKVDLLLVDFATPGMNGVELARHTRTDYPEIPVLFATGYADANGPAASMHAEMIVKKPYRLDDLAAKVREALGQRDSGTNVLPLRSPTRKP